MDARCRLCTANDTDALMWLTLQRNYDLRIIAERDKDLLARIPMLDAA